MYYVYFIRSLKDSSKTYIGYTSDLEKRLATHNAGGCPHTHENRPWKFISYVAFETQIKAMEFEKYVKIGSGHAFAKKRIW
jgi:predicted GIY-YIG superfamily endonuclease